VNPSTTLHGQPLLNFLDRAEEFWNEGAEFEEYREDDDPSEHPSGITLDDRRVALLEQMRAQRFAPASVTELRRLHELWMELDEPRAANALINEWMDGLAEAIPDPDERARARLDLRLTEAWSRHRFDLEGTRARLTHLFARMREFTDHVTAAPRLHRERCRMIQQLWERLIYLARNSQAREVMEAGCAALRAFERAHLNAHDRHETPELKDALMELFKAKYAMRWHEPEALDRHLRAAIAHLDAAPTAQEWKRLRTEALTISPAHIPVIIAASEAHLQRVEHPPPAQPILTDRAADNARWHARAWAEQERWDEALKWAARGHFMLEDDGYKRDSFGALKLEWLLKAGRMDEAATLAWQGIFHARRGLAEAACTLALEQRELDATRPEWDWILAFAQWRPGLLREGDGHGGWLVHLKQRPPLPAEAYLERAKAIAPAHPMHDLIGGVHLAGQTRWHDALPLLERGILALPEYADSDSVSLLWRARFQCLGEAETLARPFPESHGAGWCYEIALRLISDNSAESDHYPTDTRESRRALARRYYETGRTRFEAFFASGEGAFTDADYDIYSRLCNNLAIQYRLQKRFADALALHRLGIACKPNGQHYANLLRCAWFMGNYPEVIAAADQQWYGLQQHGYQGDHAYYNPARYAHHIAHSLHREGRHPEISIWIDRLGQWWDERQRLSERERQRTCRGDYLLALMVLLQYYAVEYEDKAEAILRTHLPEILALDTTSAGEFPLALILRRTAAVLENCNHPQEALALYQKAVNAAAPDETATLKTAREAIARIRSQARSRRWKFWG